MGHLTSYSILFLFTLLISKNTFGQDTIRINNKPRVIVHSWWPEFKEFPNLNVDHGKLVFTVIPEFHGLSIDHNDIDLLNPTKVVSITEIREKDNQFIIEFNKSASTLNIDSVELEIWFDLGDKTILLKKASGKNGKFLWVNIKDEYL